MTMIIMEVKVMATTTLTIMTFWAQSCLVLFGPPPLIFLHLQYLPNTSSEGVAAFVKGYNLG